MMLAPPPAADAAGGTPLPNQQPGTTLVTPFMNLALVPGSPALEGSAGIPTYFFSTGGSLTVIATVVNTGQFNGTGGAGTVPVPIYFTVDRSDSTAVNSCTTIPIDSAWVDSSGGAHYGWYNISWSLPVPSDAGVSAWNATLSLNRAPAKTHSACAGHTAGWEYHGATSTQTCGTGTLASGTPSLGDDPCNPSSQANHLATLTFVRDLRVDYHVTDLSWCYVPNASPGNNDTIDVSTCTGALDGNVNTTTPKPNLSVAFLRATIQNQGSWQDDTLPGGKVSFQIPYRYTPRSLSSVPFKPWEGTIDGVANASIHQFIVASVDFDHKMGTYLANFTLNNGGGNVPRLDMNVSAMDRLLNVSTYDFVPGAVASDFASDPAHPYWFPFDNNQLQIGGRVTIFNNGTATKDVNKVHLRAWIDTRGGPFDVNFSGAIPADVGNLNTPVQQIWFNFSNLAVSNNPSSELFLAPGVHTLYVEADDATTGGEGAFVETNESNNLFQLPLYIHQNGTVPHFYTSPVYGGLTQGTGPLDSGTNPLITTLHPHQSFQAFTAVVEGDVSAPKDTQDLTVFANFSLVSNASIYRKIPLIYNGAFANGTFVRSQIGDFAYVGNGTAENWHLRFEAADPFGNVATVDGGTIRLLKWPVQTLNDTAILYDIGGSADAVNQTNYVIPYDANLPTYSILVYRNWTGFSDDKSNTSDQINKVDNLAAYFYPPHNAPVQQAQFSPVVTCTQATAVQNATAHPLAKSNTTPDGNPWNSTLTGCSPNQADSSKYYRFVSDQVSAASIGGAGTWGVDLRITDLSGETRHIWRNITLQDLLPTLTNASIVDITDVNATNHTQAGHKLQMRVNATDDFDINLENVTVNWTRKGTNPVWFNLSLTRPHPPQPWPSPSSNKSYIFNLDNFTVGRDSDLNQAGVYTVTYVAEDVNGNWGYSAPIEYTLDEPTLPSISVEHGVDPPQQELRQPVTFYAKVSSLYNPRVELTVTDNNNQVLLDSVPMNVTAGAGDDENFTYTTNFSLSGTYAYTIRAFGSMGAIDLDHGIKTGAFQVSENLGPRIEIKSPSVNVDGQLYAPAAPTLTFLSYDAQGVDNSSFTLLVNGQQVPTTITPAPQGLNGYFFQYTVPNVDGQRFHDGDLVTVNITVFDLTGLQPGKTSLESFLNFTFKVDAKAPSARITDFSPRYKSGASQLWNVSLATTFTLGATNDDGSPVPIDRIVYSIAGGGHAFQTTYNGPFTLADNKDVYVGSTVYTISVWAYDAVGNSNITHPQQYSFFLDDEAPHLALPLIQGRYLNFTIVDEQTGVKSATLWARADNDPYQPYPMTKDAVGDVWRGVLPEGKRGQTITYYVQAVDNVDNNADGTESFGSASQPYGSYHVANHPPTISITSPALGSRVSHVVDILWTADDQDQDPITFTVAYKAPGKDGYTELSKLDSSEARRYSLDTSKLPDGEYTFRVTASDGTAATYDETTVTIINAGSAIGAVGPIGSAAPGGQVLLTAEIRKAGATVEAQLYRDNQLVDSYVMHDDGKDGDKTANDGIYSALVPVPTSGDYSVTIVAHYNEDGQQKESTLANAASFSAKLTPGYILATYAGLLVLLALLAVVGIAVAVFVVVKRRG